MTQNKTWWRRGLDDGKLLMNKIICGDSLEVLKTIESETPLGDSPEIHMEEESSGSLIPDDY